MRFGIGIDGWLTSIGSAIVAGVPFLVALVVLEKSDPEESVPGWGWFLVALVALVGLANCARRERKVAKETRRRNELLNKLLSIAKAFPDKEIVEDLLAAIAQRVPLSRANVMLVNDGKKPPVLEIKYSHRMQGSPDLELSWEKREGCCGRAWASGKQERAELSRIPQEELETVLKGQWLMRPQNIACTRDVEWIISTPLRDWENRDKIIGVLNCDSQQSPSSIDAEEFAMSLLEHAERVSRLLKLKEVLDREVRNVQQEKT